MNHCYIRRSTASQAISPKRQLEEIKSISKCDADDLNVWEEQPISGSAGLDKRPVLVEMLQSMKPNDNLFVASPSRLARSQMVYQTIVAMLHQKKINIHFADGTELDLNDSLSILLGNIMSFTAEHERMMISHRTKMALRVIRDKKALGRPDLVKYGWRSDSEGNLIQHKEEQKIIRTIVNLRSKNLSQQRIADSLNSCGLTNRAGRAFSQRRISQILAKAPRLMIAPE